MTSELHPESDRPSETAVAGGDDSRRRRRWLPAAVAAAVLVAGGGTAYLMADQGDGPGSSDPSGNPNSRAAAPADAPTAKPGSLKIDRASVSVGTPAKGILPGDHTGPGRTVYKLAGALPKGPAAAQAAAITPEKDPRARAAELAKALGVSGTPQHHGTQWTVGSGSKGGVPALSVSADGRQGWSYQKDPVLTPNEFNSRTGKGATTSSTLSPASAEAKARPVLAKLGLSGAALRTEDGAAGAQRVVAEGTAGGVPAEGRETTLTVTDRGVTAASGPLGTAKPGGDAYPLLTARQALDKLQRQPLPALLPECLARTGSTGKVSGTSITPGGGHNLGKLCDGKRTLTVKHVALGRSLSWSAGKPVLVPAWLFTVSEPSGRTAVRPQIAVQDKYLGTQQPVNPLPSAPAQDGKAGKAGKKTEQAVNAESYSLHGSTLQVHGWGDTCGTYAARAETSGGTVSVHVTEARDAKQVCVDLAKQWTAEVKLDKVPSGLKVVDAKDGKALSAHAPAMHPLVKHPALTH